MKYDYNYNDDDFYDKDDRYDYYDEDAYDEDDYFDEDYEFFDEELEDNFVCQNDMDCPYGYGMCDDCEYKGECSMCEHDGNEAYCKTCIYRERD